MDEKTFVDAVFAYFGEDDPAPDLLELLKARCEPRAKELEEITGAFGDEGSEDDHDYADKVMFAVGAFNDNPDDYIGKLADDDPRKVGLVAIAEAKKARDSVSAQADAPPHAAEQPPAQADAPQPDKAPSKRRPVPVDLAMSSVAMTSAKPIVRTTPKPGDEQGAKPSAKPDADSDLDRKGEIANAVPGDAVTQAHRVWLARSEWITMRDAIIRAFTAQDNRQLQTAQRAADGYKAGQRGGDYRLLGQLIELLLADLRAGLQASDVALFTRRYWA